MPVSDKIMLKIIKIRAEKIPIKAVVMDFDGTISTLRYGWEDIMQPMCLEFIAADNEITDELKREVAEYIDNSTGIQTIHQMNWLAERVKSYGKSTEIHDGWWYKAEYNRRLMVLVEERISDIKTGKKSAGDYLMQGSVRFLEALKANNIPIYVASGTDTDDVVNEATILGVAKYFNSILGAKIGEVSCSKEAVIKELMSETGLFGEQIMVIGDGKVEIRLAAESNGFAVGIASDEEERTGINLQKEARLVAAGANIIIDDFSDYEQIFEMAGIV